MAPVPARSTPTYQQLAAELSDLCQQLPGGTRLPSENELASEHGVSRLTARAALQELENRQIVRRQRGSGTYVATRIPYRVQAGMAPSWTAIVAAAGHEPAHRVVSVDTVRAPAAVARALLLPRGRTVVRIERIGLVDDEPASHHVSFVPVALAPDLARRVDAGSLTTLLSDGYGLEPDRWWSRAEMATIPIEVARSLALTGRPLAWRIDSVNVCRRRGTPIESTTGWLRSDHFRVLFEFGPSDGAAPAPVSPIDPSAEEQP